MRITPQRLAVYESIGVLDHPAVDEIYGNLHETHPALSVATIYNTVERLVHEDLVRVIMAHGKRRYDLRLDHHDHLLCQICHRLEDCPDDFPAVQTRVPQGVLVNGQQWTIHQQTVIWEGVCPDCTKSIP